MPWPVVVGMPSQRLVLERVYTVRLRKSGQRKRAGDNLGPKTKRGKVKASEKRGRERAKKKQQKMERRERREQESE